MAVVYETKFAVRLLAINAVTWTDIYGSALPIDCNTVIIFNNTGVDIFLRSDPSNPNSQITIQTGQQFEIGTTGLPATAGLSRFPKGSAPLGSLLSSSGNVSPVIESLQ